MPAASHEVIYFSGHVQGVGFRYSALQVAKEFEVAGYVSNLADGRVLVEAQGDPREIGKFVAAIEERMHGHIRKTERSARTGAERLQGFTIR